MEGSLPSSWSRPRLAGKGILVVQGEPYVPPESCARLHATCDALHQEHPLNRFPWIVLVDDSDFATRNLDNFLWTTFTRSNPATDVYGIGAFYRDKHFGCEGSLVIDARRKPHHAPGLLEDQDTLKKVDARAARGDALSRYL